MFMWLIFTASLLAELQKPFCQPFTITAGSFEKLSTLLKERERRKLDAWLFRSYQQLETQTTLFLEIHNQHHIETQTAKKLRLLELAPEEQAQAKQELTQIVVDGWQEYARERICKRLEVGCKARL